jgi:hypothetical protein
VPEQPEHLKFIFSENIKNLVLYENKYVLSSLQRNIEKLKIVFREKHCSFRVIPIILK